MSDADAGPIGRTDANGSRTGPKTRATRPMGRFLLSTTGVPTAGAGSQRARASPPDAVFSTMPLRELLREDDRMEAFLDSPAAYSQSNGTPELRSILADHYRGATPDQILVTCGSSEANFLAPWRLVDKGDEVVLMLPTYMQIWGLVRGFGGKVRPLRLREDLGWQFDPEDLKASVTSKTRAIAICNPNNPTGAVMGHDQRRAVLDAAADADAWLLSDEVYLGAEREGPRAESLWGDHEKTLISNGLSKAYGLPGLRIGWLVGPPKEDAGLWSHPHHT